MLIRRMASAEPEAQHEEQDGLRLEILNTFPALEDALDLLEAYCEGAGGSPREASVVRLVLEELVTDTIKYGYDDDAEHRIRVDFKAGPPAVMTIEDDGHPFNPLADAPEPDLAAPAEQRPIGGLGLHMVKALTAGLQYQRIGPVNRLMIEFLPSA